MGGITAEEDSMGGITAEEDSMGGVTIEEDDALGTASPDEEDDSIIDALEDSTELAEDESEGTTGVEDSPPEAPVDEGNGTTPPGVYVNVDPFNILINPLLSIRTALFK
jgi:hypothetical protein